MDRISTATKAVDLYGAGKHGFKDGDLANSILPTDLNAAWFNMVQEELLGVIESSGQAAAAGTLNQVTKAIKRFAGANVKTVTAGVSALTVDDVGMVLVDATAGNITLNLPAANVVAALGMEFTFYRVDSTGNTVTINRAGADTIDGVNSFTIAGQFAYRTIKGNANAAWATKSVSPTASSSVIQSITVAMAANAMTVTISPTSLDFRSSALSVGAPNTRTISAPLSLVVPAGATLGVSSGVINRIAVLAIDNAGTVEAAVVNMAGGLELLETGLISTTAMSAAADLPSVVYSAIARANVPYRVVGFLESTQAVAGNWATAASLVQGIGGLATAEIFALLSSQIPQNVTGSRSLGVSYTNTKRRRIEVGVTVTVGSSLSMTTEVAGLTYVNNTASGAEVRDTTFPVPPGAVYRVSAAGSTLVSWTEL